MTVVSIAEKDLKDALNKIIEDLDLNLKQTLMSKDDRTETKQKINILKNLIAWVAYKINSRSVKVE